MPPIHSSPSTSESFSAVDTSAGSDSARSLLDAMPIPAFIVNEDISVLTANTAASAFVDAPHAGQLRMRGGEALSCINATRTADGCGRAPECKDCVIRGSVREAAATGRAVRRRARLERKMGSQTAPAHFLVTASPILGGEPHRFLLLLEDLTTLLELGQLVPICASCKKVRDAENHWNPVEDYFQSHLDISFSHGVCPDCARMLYPGLGEDR